MLKSLTGGPNPIPCTYALLPALPSLLPEVTTERLEAAVDDGLVQARLRFKALRHTFVRGAFNVPEDEILLARQAFRSACDAVVSGARWIGRGGGHLTRRSRPCSRRGRES